MWTQTSALLLLLACCLCPTEVQSNSSRRQSTWNDPIKFDTKAKDLCIMSITGHGEYTRLRLSCQSNKRSYWCDYVGKPYMCGPYNKNPRHYFIQMKWGLRKLHNACHAPRTIKPHMCRKANNDSQMVFSSASFSQTWPKFSKIGSGPAVQPARPHPQPEPGSARQVSTKSIQVSPKITQQTSPQTTAPTVESNPKRIAHQYCWRSLKGVCAFLIGLFQD